MSVRFSCLLLVITCIAAAAQPASSMRPRVMMGDSAHCDAIMVRDGHLVLETVCTGPQQAEVAWDGHTALITHADELASQQWLRAHSVLNRLSTKHNHLYWDGKKVDLGKVDVGRELFEAIAWQDGVLVYGRTYPRRSFFQSWPFKGHFIEVRDLEPFCAIYFNPQTLKGEDLYINGKAYRGLFVYPIPDERGSR